MSINGIFYYGYSGSEYWKYDGLMSGASVSGGTAPYKWVVSQGNIPKGLMLYCSNSDNQKGEGNVGQYCHLSGIAARGGTYDFTLKVTDAKGKTAEKKFSVEIKGGDIDNIVINNVYPTGSNYMYSGYSEVVNGGRAPYKWSIVNGLLPGSCELACSDSNDSDNAQKGNTIGRYAHIKGATNGKGTFNFVLRVTDADGRSAYTKSSIKIDNMSSYEDPNADAYAYIPKAVKIANGDFWPSEFVYTQGEKVFSVLSDVGADGANLPCTWDVTCGKLPDGISFNTQDSLTTDNSYIFWRGIPETAGIYSFTLRVKDTY